MEWFKNKVNQLQDRIEDRLEPLDDIGEDQSLLGQINEATTLNRTQKLLGFLVCFSLGMVLSFLAPAFLLRPIKLATTLTLGNVLSICSMMFLVGPAKQCSSMLDSKRWIATTVYIASLIFTLLAAFLVKSRLLCLACIIIQYLALAWYSLSYIPYGQAMVLRVMGYGGGDMV